MIEKVCSGTAKNGGIQDKENPSGKTIKPEGKL